MKDNVSKIRDCYGCGVCSPSCPKKIIDIRLNENGFYEPRIDDEDKCINCGICLDVCAFNHVDLPLKTKPLKSWGGWSKEHEVQRKCSSGGIGFEILRQLFDKGYKVIACRYNADTERAEHFLPNTSLELIETIGSKYIQSYTPIAFSQIKRNEKYVIVGTPCQIDSFRRYIKRFKIEDNVILVDFFCHCVPSMWVWRGYLDMVRRKIGDITSASWRNKFEYGWHDSWQMNLDNQKKEDTKPLNWHDSYNLNIKEKKGKWLSRKSQGDIFYKLFLGDIAMNSACSKNCKYKYDHSSADIRLGDFWGNTYKDNQDGVSAVVAFTPKGLEVMESLANIELKEYPFDVVGEGQMKKNAEPKEVSSTIMFLLKRQIPFSNPLYKGFFFIQKIINRFKKIIK